MLRPLLILALLPVLATAEVHDLGENLGYLRLRDAATEAIPDVNGALVLDLRQAEDATTTAAERVRPLLAGPGARFVLISRTTAPALLALLAEHSPTVFTLGAAGAPDPDFTVNVSAEDDRRAYDALDQGTPLASLASPPLTKPRRDEASILQDRARRSGAPPPPAAAAPPPEEPAAAPAGDPVLQRAVQLYRGLRALKAL